MLRDYRPALIAIVGPNASGKSDLAVSIARHFRGEIISADSRQIYRGLDIGTGKVPGRWARNRRSNKRIFIYRGIPHHCIDFVSPRRTYSAAEFQRCAGRAIRDVALRGKLPIVVGGSGFWLDTLVHGYALPSVAPDAKLRRALAGRSPRELLVILQRLDPRRAKTIERENPRRLVRAIEIARALGRIPELRRKPPYRTLWLGVDYPDERLQHRIRIRLAGRLRRGMIAEARRLRREGLPWKRFYELGLEYRFLADYLRAKIKKSELVSGLERAIWNYAKRQRRWFRPNRSIRWLASASQAERLVRRFAPLTPTGW